MQRLRCESGPMSEGAVHRLNGFEDEAVAVPEHQELAEHGGGVNGESVALVADHGVRRPGRIVPPGHRARRRASARRSARSLPHAVAAMELDTRGISILLRAALSVPGAMDPKEVDLDTALGLLALPREVGAHPASGEPVLAGIGRYGPWVRHRATYAAIADDDDVLAIGLNRAVHLLGEKELRHRFHDRDAVGPGQDEVEQHERRLLGPHDLGELAMLAGHQRRIARPGERVAHVAQRLRVVVDHQHARLLRGRRKRPRALRGGAGRGPGRLGRGQREGEARALPGPAALGPDAPAMGLDQTLADGQPEPRRAGPGRAPARPGMPAEQMRQPIGRDAPSLVDHRERDMRPSRSADTRFGEDAGALRAALTSGLFSTCTMRPGSAIARGRSGARSMSTACRAPPERNAVRASSTSSPGSEGSGATESVPAPMRPASSRSSMSTLMRPACSSMMRRNCCVSGAP